METRYVVVQEVDHVLEILTYDGQWDSLLFKACFFYSESDAWTVAKQIKGAMVYEIELIPKRLIKRF